MIFPLEDHEISIFFLFLFFCLLSCEKSEPRQPHFYPFKAIIEVMPRKADWTNWSNRSNQELILRLIWSHFKNQKFKNQRKTNTNQPKTNELTWFTQLAGSQIFFRKKKKRLALIDQIKDYHFFKKSLEEICIK